MGPKDLTKIYSESFGSLSDAEKQQIRKQLLGLNNDGDEVQFKENKDALLVKILQDNTLGVKAAQQDAFRGLAADLLKTTVDQLKKQKAKEAEFEMFKGLPGFNEIAGIDFGKYTATGYVTPADIGVAAETKEELEIVMSNA